MYLFHVIGNLATHPYGVVVCIECTVGCGARAMTVSASAHSMDGMPSRMGNFFCVSGHTRYPSRISISMSA